MSKITQKITAYSVKSTDEKPPVTLIEREETLNGKTYKIKPPDSDHAIYVTINDLNGSPYEVFINCKNPESHGWMMTVTRLISAILRTGQNPKFMIDELKNVPDPRGGYFYPKLGFVPSISAHIGIILEKHIEST